MNSSPGEVPLDYKFESIAYPNTIFMTRKMRALVRNEKLMNELKDLKKIANRKSRVLSNQEFNELKVIALIFTCHIPVGCLEMSRVFSADLEPTFGRTFSKTKRQSFFSSGVMVAQGHDTLLKIKVTRVDLSRSFT